MEVLLTLTALQHQKTELGQIEGCITNILNVYNATKVLQVDALYRLHTISTIKVSSVNNCSGAEQVKFCIIAAKTLHQLRLALDCLQKTHWWNAEVVLVITSKLELAEVLKLTWTFYAVNVLVVADELKIYTYNPLGDKSWCPDLRPVYLQSCTQPFKAKANKKFNFIGCTFTTSFLENKPYAIDRKSKTDPGILVLINDGLQRTLGYTVGFNSNYTEYGVKLLNGTYTDIMKDLQDGGIDYYIGNVANLTYMQDFTYIPQFFKSYYYFWVPRAGRASAAENLLLVFSSLLWLYICLTFILLTLICSILRDHEDGSFRNFAFCILTLWRITFSFNEATPTTPKLKLIMVLWTFASLILVSAYEGSMNSFMFLPRYEHQISTVEDILTSNLPIGGSYFVYDFYKILETTTAKQIIKNFTICPSTDSSCVRRVADSADLIANKDTRSVYYHWKDFQDEQGNDKIFRVECGVSVDFGIYLRKGHVLVENFRELSIRFLESGLLTLWDRYVEHKEHKLDEKMHRSLKLEHLTLAFTFFALGNVLSCLSLVMEMILSRIK